jgi:phenylacetate-CoA ligase
MTWARYYDEQAETMPAAWTRRLEEELLAEQVFRCWERAPFYRRRLADAGIRPEHVQKLEDLRLLPFTTREELRESQAASPPFGDYVCAEHLEIPRGRVASTGAGRPLVVGYTERDLRMSAEIGARDFWACGARPDDTILHCRADGVSAGGLSDHLALEATGATAVPVGHAEAEGLLEHWDALAATGLLSARAYPDHLAETVREHGHEPRSLGLRRMIVAGASVGTADRRRLADVWGADVGGCYGVADVWETLAGECEEQDGLHFCGQGGTLVELVEPGGGEPLEIEPGAEGELVLTHLDREASPLLRFRTGDVARVLGVECPCGRTGVRFRIEPMSDTAAPGHEARP